MPIEAVKIPQNVQIEDKIVGPLTLRHLIMLLLGGGVSYAIYSVAVKTYGKLGIVPTVICWIPLGIMAMFALVRVNDLSLFRICLLMFERMNKPPIRVWSPRPGIAINIRLATMDPHAKAAAPKKDPALEAQHEKRVKELSSFVDRELFKRDAAPASATPNAHEDSFQEIMQETPEPEHKRASLPVNRDRIAVDGKSAATLTSAPLFTDISPSHS